MNAPLAIPTLDAAAPLSVLGDTVRMPWAGADAERVVRPALAVLYRMAVGPRADYYVPRFLAFERTRRSVPSWHWPSFFLPSVWAFYRKLWVAGIVFALLPFAGAAAFAAIEPALGESNAAWLALAALCIWFVPCVVPALLANGRCSTSCVRRSPAPRRAGAAAPTWPAS